MYKNKKILAIIPARGGSKGLPNKNIILLNGKELIGYSIEFAQKMEFIDKIIVSSDSERILKIAKKFGSEILKRPSNLASDSSKMSEVIKYTSSFYDNKFDFIILLQPTNPIRSLVDISQSIKDFIDSSDNYDSLMPINKSSSKIGIIKNNLYVPNNKGEYNRQELRNLYTECGTLFVYKKEMLKESNIIGTRIFPYIVKNKIETFDIDTLEDLHINESILLRNSL